MRHAAKKQSRRELMAEVTAEYERSGLTRRSFSEVAGIPVSTLDYWRRQVRNVDRAKIVPVKIERTDSVGTVDRSAGFQLQLPNGVRIESRWDFPEQDLARLLRVAGER